MTSPTLHTARGAAMMLIIAGAIVWASSQAFATSANNVGTERRQPVLVELFTSEGCSDCPPADALLAKLDETQFVPGADAIVLSEHVTYWNREGWTDPFSMEEMTQRQQDYETEFGLSSSYTPQFVVDGAAQIVGANEGALVRDVERAVEKPKKTLAIENVHWAGNTAYFSVRGPAGVRATLVAVLAADATHSEVSRGENAGRTLHHVAVVQAIKEFGSKDAHGCELHLGGGNLDHGTEAKEPVRLVVFLADNRTGHVIAVAEQTLQR